MVYNAPNMPVLMPVERAQVYSPGRHLIFTKNPTDLTVGYSPGDIDITFVAPPKLTDNMERIWSARYKQKFSKGVKRAGKFTGMVRPSSTEGRLGLDLFESGYLDWNLTLPQGDKYDSMLDAECIRSYFCIHHAPITVDKKLIYVSRGLNRASWTGRILATHSWGDDIDKDYSFDEIVRKLSKGQGAAMFEQAKYGVIREINPFEDSKSPDIPNRVLEEILHPEDVTISSANCLTLTALPKELGYHLCFTAHIDKEAGELLEERNNYPMVGRISGYHSVDFTEGSMADFFRRYADRLALTIEPTMIMACVQEFGEGFLDELPYEVLRQSRDY